MILRCTGKVLALLRVPATSLPVVEPAPGDWYVNLVRVGGRKCLLVTHAGTLFSVFVPDVRVADLRPPGPLLTSRIRAALRAESLPEDALGDLDADEVTVTKTAGRQVLGVMNDHLMLVEHVLADRGGLTERGVDGVHHALHRTINSTTGYVPPVELVAGTG